MAQWCTAQMSTLASNACFWMTFVLFAGLLPIWNEVDFRTVEPPTDTKQVLADAVGAARGRSLQKRCGSLDLVGF